MRALLLLLLFCSLTIASAYAAQPDGLYLMTRMNMGSSLEISGWYFKNGQVSNRPTGNLAAFDFKAAAAKNPDLTGTYSISGKKMTIKWANGKQSTGDYEPGDHNCFYWDMGSFCPAEPFAKGAKLEGVFEGGTSAGYGRVANAHEITFSANGQYKMESAASVKSEVSNGTQLAGGATGTESGTYQLSGTTMTLSGGGKTRQVVAFPYDDGSKGPQPNRVFFDAIMLKRIK